MARIAGDEKRVTDVLNHVPGIAEVICYGEKEDGVCEYALEPKDGTDFRRALFTALAKEGFPLLGLRSLELSLEEIFILLTREKLPQATRKGGKTK